MHRRNKTLFSWVLSYSAFQRLLPLRCATPFWQVVHQQNHQKFYIFKIFLPYYVCHQIFHNAVCSYVCALHILYIDPICTTYIYIYIYKTPRKQQLEKNVRKGLDQNPCDTFCRGSGSSNMQDLDGSSHEGYIDLFPD